MAASRTGVSSLRKLLRAVCKLAQTFPTLLSGSDVPIEIQGAVIALIAVCTASTFDDPHAGEISGAGVIP